MFKPFMFPVLASALPTVQNSVTLVISYNSACCLHNFVIVILVRDLKATRNLRSGVRLAELLIVNRTLFFRRRNFKSWVYAQVGRA
jgi:hypothetical protein